MAMSTSKTPGQNPSDDYDYDQFEDLIARCIQYLGLDYEPEEAVHANSSKIKNQLPPDQQSDVQTQWLSSRKSDSDHESISGYRVFFHGENISDSNTPNYRRLLEIENCEPYHGDRCRNPTRAMSYEDILKGELCEEKEALIHTIQEHVIELMIDKQMHPIFESLLDACDIQHLDSLVGVIYSERESFINAAFRKEGARSIFKLIRKLKKSSHAFTITEILSTRFMEIMCDYTARKVIQTCLVVFGNRPNEILYQKTIYYCLDLAMHKVGCRSLNDCINTISGDLRARLFDSIAYASDYLSFDTYGNYVVQKLLQLGDIGVTANIMCVLKGHHVKLAQHKIGSNVVEKCMDYSIIGLVDVLKEILSYPKTPYLLAQSHFGNYVIQRALEKAKEHGLSETYKSLVGYIRPYYKELERTIGGRNVIDFIEKQSVEASPSFSDIVENV